MTCQLNGYKDCTHQECGVNQWLFITLEREINLDATNSVLDSLLFKTFINDLEEVMEGMPNKISHTKLAETEDESKF